MEVPHNEGVASHVDPESCVWVRENQSEALTGESTGRVLSRESILVRRADEVPVFGRQYRSSREARERIGLCEVRDPVHVWKFHAQESGYLAFGLVER